MVIPMRAMLVVIGLLLINAAYANNLYQQEVTRARISDSHLDEVVEQIEQYKEFETQTLEFVPPFHFREARQLASKPVLCISCHGDLPHRKSPRSRTFVNMHSEFMACESCHFRPESAEIEYRWLNFSEASFGMEVMSVSNSSGASSDGVVQRHLSEPTQEKVRRLIPQPSARLVPFINEVAVVSLGENSPLMSDRKFTTWVAEEWRSDKVLERAKIKAKLHAPLDEKGPECVACHNAKEPMMDFNSLGASPRQIRALENNTVARFFDRFKHEEQKIRIIQLLR